MRLTLAMLATILVTALKAQASPSCHELRSLQADLAVRASNIRNAQLISVANCKLGECELLPHADFRFAPEAWQPDSGHFGNVSYPEVYPQDEIAMLNSIARKLIELAQTKSCGARVSGTPDAALIQYGDKHKITQDVFSSQTTNL